MMKKQELYLNYFLFRGNIEYIQKMNMEVTPKSIRLKIYLTETDRKDLN
jgi:predicted membrane GTPase involved in stress response